MINDHRRPQPSVAPRKTSWWLEEALQAEGNRPPNEPLTGERRVDVVIVGGGFTGLWAALALHDRRPTLSIALIESELCGAGASGKNGGKVHGYWSSLPGAAKALGDDGALAIARAGTWAQDGIRAFALRCGRDVWWRDGGNIVVSTTPAQDSKLSKCLSEARRLGVPDSVVPLSPAELNARCRSPAFRTGIFFPEAATVHPARLARALRQAVNDRGVAIYEQTPMIGIDPGPVNRIRTPKGQLFARDVVLATNAALTARPEIRPHLSVFSSYAVMTEPVPEGLAEIGWTGDEGLSDRRMFLHYFRKTPDGRVLMGSGSGPIGYGAWVTARRLRTDRASAARAEAGLRRLLPDLGSVRLSAAWGGAIDVSSDRLPFFRTVPGRRIHYGCGYSGHGVNATYIGGQCLASLVLGETDRWSTLPFCTRELPRLPMEPFRFLGANAIRWGILTCEEAEEADTPAPVLARAIAAMPELLGLRIGVR